MRDLADISSDLYELDRAIAYYEEAIALQKKQGLTGELMITLNNLGTLYSDLGRYEEARTIYDKVIRLAQAENDKATLATTYNNLGNVWGRLGYADRALYYYQESLSLERRLGRPASLSYVLNNIGMEYFRAEKYEEALKYLSEALAIDKSLNNPHLLETRLNNIGALYLRQGRYAEAERIFLERKQLELRIRPNRLIHSGLIEVYLLTGRYDEALELAQALPPSWRDGRNRHIEYHMQVGLALKGKRSLNAAAEHLQQAIALTEDLRQSIGEKAQFFAGGGYYRPLAPYRAIIAVLAEMDDRHVPLRGILDNTRARLMARRGIQERLSDFGSPADRAFYFQSSRKHGAAGGDDRYPKGDRRLRPRPYPEKTRRGTSYSPRRSRSEMV